jgi:biotin carboxyl carrier protein
MSASDLTVTTLGSDRFLVADGTRQRVAYAVATPAAQWVFIDGHVYVIEDEKPPDRRVRRTNHETTLSSPMPAMVVLVNVEAGQRVEAGDLLVMLEAMKMELPITAPRAARVVSIGCRRGEMVQPGVPLIDLTQDPDTGSPGA